MSRKFFEYSYEQLVIKSDHELRKLFVDLRGAINKGRRKRSNTRKLEIEFCYLQKEIQDRRCTKKS